VPLVLQTRISKVCNALLFSVTSATVTNDRVFFRIFLRSLHEDRHPDDHTYEGASGAADRAAESKGVGEWPTK